MSAPLQTIVVATDFSANAAVAQAWAAELARAHGASIVLVHAMLPDAPPLPEVVALPPQYFEEMRSGAQRLLDAAVTTLRESGLQASSELVIGSAVSGLVEAAARHHGELIVAGTRGRTGWRRILLGSTVTRLVREARCAVLTVHPSEAGPPRAPHTVLVPTDFSEEAAHAGRSALDLFGAAIRRVVLLNVYRVPNEAAHLREEQFAEAIHQTRTAALARLETEAAAMRRPGVAVETIAREGHPPEIVLANAKALGADLIAMGTRGHGALDALLMGSTAARVLPWATCPVLTVRRHQPR
jgi:nucleotide-binding universal stress UspA family protein